MRLDGSKSYNSCAKKDVGGRNHIVGLWQYPVPELAIDVTVHKMY